MSQHYLAVRDEWLAARQEEILDPGQRIVDPHHHLWERPGWRYRLDDILADIRTGHDVYATVLVQARAFHRADGPEELRPVGETQYAAGVAAMCESGIYGDVRVCAGIVGFADLTRGAAAGAVLDAHLAAGNGRFRGIRHIATWDTDPEVLNPAYTPAEDMLDSAGFRAGIAELGKRGLSFDSWMYFHQIPKLAAPRPRLPRGADGAQPLRRRPRHRPICRPARRGVRDLVGEHARPRHLPERHGEGRRPRHAAARPWAWRKARSRRRRRCWPMRGSRGWNPASRCSARKRCMFESNFPVDKGGYGYAAGWNAFKRLAAGASAEEKADLFWRAATRFYRLA